MKPYYTNQNSVDVYLKLNSHKFERGGVCVQMYCFQRALRWPWRLNKILISRILQSVLQGFFAAVLPEVVDAFRFSSSLAQALAVWREELGFGG